MPFDQLMDLLESAGYELRAYSGRGMVGRECVGVTVDDVYVLIADLLMQISDGEGLENLADLLRDTRTDSMGLSTIVYWPAVRWEGPTEDFEEES